MSNGKKNNQSGYNKNKIIEPEIQLTYVELLWKWIRKEERFEPSTIIRLALFASLAIFLALFHLWTSYFGILEAWLHRAIHINIVIILVYLRPSGKLTRDKKGRLKAPYNKIDILFLILSSITLVYCYFNYFDIIMREGIPNIYDQIFCTILVILLLEAARRLCGFPIVVIAVLLLFYAMFGYLIQGSLGIPGFSYEKLTDQLFNSIAGIFGIPLGAAAVYIVIFIIFGSFLVKSKAGEIFIKLAVSIAGGMRGGPAKVAIIASALVATIHGSGPGNVAMTGVFTIPLMKRIGYDSHFAGGVEAAASTGGILTPPVMGATAFVIAEFTRVSYWRVCLVALVPALFYYLAVFSMVHFEAVKKDLKPVPKNEIPNTWQTFKEGGYMLLPLVMIICILIIGFSPMRAGFYAITLTFLLSLFRKNTRMNFIDFLGACELGARNVLMVSIACGVAGIIGGLVSLTGLGAKLSIVLISISGGNLFLILFFTMIICIILGMGMPVTPAYIITVTIGGLAITRMGMDTLVAHMFVFYFATMAAITPPVALSSYAAAGIAGAGLSKTSFVAFKLAFAGFIVPYIFIYKNYLLIGYGNWKETTFVFFLTSLAIILFSGSFQRCFFNPSTFIVSSMGFIAALLLIISGWFANVIGVVLAIITLLLNHSQNKISNSL